MQPHINIPQDSEHNPIGIGDKIAGTKYGRLITGRVIKFTPKGFTLMITSGGYDRIDNVLKDFGVALIESYKGDPADYLRHLAITYSTDTYTGKKLKAIEKEYQKNVNR